MADIGLRTGRKESGVAKLCDHLGLAVPRQPQARAQLSVVGERRSRETAQRRRAKKFLSANSRTCGSPARERKKFGLPFAGVRLNIDQWSSSPLIDSCSVMSRPPVCA